MTGTRILVADANVARVRKWLSAERGATTGESYAQLLREIAPDARVDICMAADPDPMLAAPLDSYDGIAITGSALNIYDAEPPVLRQIEFARTAFAAAVPIFGSCWGLQLGTVAAGGEVARNPRGREVGFARGVQLTDEGRSHAMHLGRDAVFDAPAMHMDEVVRLPEPSVVTARNRMSVIQAAEIRHGKGEFWGVQYHPEYTLEDVAVVIRALARSLVSEGFFADAGQLEAYVADLDSLRRDANRHDIAWRFALGDDILCRQRRVLEIVNWLSARVRGSRDRRG